MNRLNRNLLAAATATALGVGGAGAAQAAFVSAYSHLKIDNFQILKSDDSQYSADDFSDLLVGNNSSTGATTSVHGGDPVDTTLDTTLGDGNGDDNLSCVGACGDIVDDEFFQQPQPASGNSFARGDTLLQGALITGIADQDFVTADALSETQADNIEDDGEGNSSVGTGTEFIFTPANDGETMTFDFDAAPFLELVLESSDAGQNFASLNFSISIVEEDGTPFYNFAPGALNESRTRLSGGTTTYDPGLLSFTDTTDPLEAGVRYVLSIDHRSRATFQSEVQVPAPATLGLFGLGLLALGWITRRRALAA